MTLELYIVIQSIQIYVSSEGFPSPSKTKQNQHQLMSIVGHHFVEPKKYLLFSHETGLGKT